MMRAEVQIFICVCGPFREAIVVTKMFFCVVSVSIIFHRVRSIIMISYRRGVIIIQGQYLYLA